MRYALLSDLHSNLQATQKCLEICADRKTDKTIFLGDAVGYNANPKECVELIQGLDNVALVLQGNHDQYAADTHRIPRNLTDRAVSGVMYAADHLSEEQRDWLRSLPTLKRYGRAGIKFVAFHGWPSEMGPFEYILGKNDAWYAAIAIRARNPGYNVGIFGHTHYPTMCRIPLADLDNAIKTEVGFLGMRDKDNVEFHGGEEIMLPPVNKWDIEDEFFYLINPGSVGQPRIAHITSFAILDTIKKTIEYVQFSYNWQDAKNAVLEATYDSIHSQESIAKSLEPVDITKERLYR
jgi:predicted phosphodiesterase